MEWLRSWCVFIDLACSVFVFCFQRIDHSVQETDLHFALPEATKLQNHQVHQELVQTSHYQHWYSAPSACLFCFIRIDSTGVISVRIVLISLQRWAVRVKVVTRLPSFSQVSWCLWTCIVSNTELLHFRRFLTASSQSKCIFYAITKYTVW